MDKESKIVVLGASGLVGGAIVRKLIEKGYENIIGTYKSRKPNFEKIKLIQVDLTNQLETEKFFKDYQPEYVFLAAAKVGGILANNTYKADFIYENLSIALNVIHSAYKYGVKKLLNLGSSCIYPKYAPQPMKEEYLLTDSLEPTNEPYAIAKISAIKLCRYYNEQYGTNFISAMPSNLYGPGDNFNLETSHVLPALIRKFHLAKLLKEGDIEGIKKDFKKHTIGFGLDKKIDFNDDKSVLEILSQIGITYTDSRKVKITLWGSGEVYREFLYVDDLADACVFLMENIDAKDMQKLCADYFVNIGTGEDIKIKDLAVMIRDIVGAECDIVYDRTKPDGTPRKLLDVSKINQLGWKYKTSLEEGIKRTYEFYIKNT
ncbi:GDP-L-fucose synthase family protein [Sulfurihydrogenibium azorense]|jgi:GDP-L-fucose synthase|uniref:GDP-L-fucose synthase n=1 Tax=Sulfurihydrogenibium azorense (strain DSM 15241 / OCM 825 / Az-Fu1) TaxID=204536 RepID=C1DVN6_SULAA|nr:GDP-L-fucose synthase [Sulfurihydrogenibium azorense]ACN98149.1 GDP-L-fucose synthetase (GDP-4-keto-6-deoxy-D-mannose-3,5-epimerase-4-reductase) [Sulfurihydrogenibium azorense Az-Fu1]